MRYVPDGVNNLQLVGPNQPGYDIDLAPAPGAYQTVNVNAVPSHEVYTLSGSYDFALSGGNSLQLYGVIDNLHDDDPRRRAAAVLTAII